MTTLLIVGIVVYAIGFLVVLGAGVTNALLAHDLGLVAIMVIVAVIWPVSAPFLIGAVIGKRAHEMGRRKPWPSPN